MAESIAGTFRGVIKALFVCIHKAVLRLYSLGVAESIAGSSLRPHTSVLVYEAFSY